MNFSMRFFGTHRKMPIILWVRKYTDRKIQKHTEKLHYFSVRDNTHTEKINTHRKIVTILSAPSKLTEKLYARTEKL
jgi:hypothetical protein